MKKALYLLFTLVLCLALFSCAQEPETTPNETETVTPETTPDEVETVTPNEPEVVEPEVVEPEVVEPEVVEPEPPVAPEDERFPYIGEVTVELGNKEMTLPAEDENTKRIIIPYPEDFVFGYEEPEFVSPEEFDWGDYVPFVRYETSEYEEMGTPFYAYAFLGENVSELTEGTKLYNDVNRIYKKTFTYSLENTLWRIPLLHNTNAIPLVSESRVIYLSTDAKTVGNFYLKNAGTAPDGRTEWDGQYEIYENGKHTSTDTVKQEIEIYQVYNRDGHAYFNHNDGGFLNYETGAYVPPETAQLKEPDYFRWHIHNDSNSVLYTYNDLTKIYSLDENKLKYKIKFDFETAPIGKNYYINQFLTERYLVITFYSNYTDGLCHNVYLFDLETEEMTRINGYSFNPLLSPDKKYLIYTNYHEFGQGVNSRCNYDYAIKTGFYIKNLETGETTFYENDKHYEYSSNQPLNWIEKDGLNSLLDAKNSILPTIPERKVTIGEETHTFAAEDEDTKTIFVDFPKDLILGYTKPELVSPEDFEWGDYRPFVRYMIDSYGELGSTPIYLYSFLGSGISSLTEGNALYEKLNSKYKKTFERSEEELSHFMPYEKKALPLVKESRVIYVSEDCNEIGNFYLEKAEPVPYDYLSWEGLPIYNYNTWTGVYESYKNGELAYTSDIPHNENGYIDLTDGGTLRNIPYEYLTHQYEGIYPIFCHNNGNTEVYSQYYDRHKRLITVYSTNEKKLKYKVAMDFYHGAIETYTMIHQILNDRYLLISFHDYFRGHGPCNNLYLLDLETEEMTRVNEYCFYPMISPDGKYLIYTNYYEFGQGVNSPQNESYEMDDGFYVKNLETGETTFFENPTQVSWGTSNQPLNWVEKDALEEICK